MAEFYVRALGGVVVGISNTGAQVRTATGTTLGFQQIDGYVTPTCPSRVVPQQMHLECVVDDIDRARSQTPICGVSHFGIGRCLIRTRPFRRSR